MIKCKLLLLLNVLILNCTSKMLNCNSKMLNCIVNSQLGRTFLPFPQEVLFLSCLTRYEKNYLRGLIGMQKLLKFTCLTMKFHNRDHTTVHHGHVTSKLIFLMTIETSTTQ